MKTISFIGRFTNSISVLSFVFTLVLHSQPRIQIKEIRVDWPEVHITPKFFCGSEQREIVEANLLIHENGSAIKNFIVYCMHGDGHCCASFPIIIDRSRYMNTGNPSGLVNAKNAANAIVDAMDGECDESAIISFSKTSIVNVFMTNDKVVLKQGIDALNNESSSALWDAVYKGIEELVNYGTQECRGVVLISSGYDDNSILTSDDVIAFAKANKVRIYTIGYGDNIASQTLRMIADSTEGKYLKSPTVKESLSIYTDIISFDRIWCDISYVAQCGLPSLRKIDIKLQKLFGCPGVDSATVSYIAPFDTLNIPIVLKLGSAIVQGGEKIGIPLTLETKLNQLFPGASFKIKTNSFCMTLDTIIKGNVPFYFPKIYWKSVPDGYEITLPFRNHYDTTGIIATLWFNTNKFDSDTKCQIELRDWIFEGGCLNPVLISGEVTILGKQTDIKQIPSPSLFYLEQNYPNPFSTSTTINLTPTLSLNKERENIGQHRATLKVFDVFGREVLDLSDQIDNSKLTIDNSPSANQLPNAGIYFYRLTIGKESQTKMMVLLK